MTLESVLAEVVREAVAPLAQQVAELTAAVQASIQPVVWVAPGSSSLKNSPATWERMSCSRRDKSVRP